MTEPIWLMLLPGTPRMVMVPDVLEMHRFSGVILVLRAGFASTFQYSSR